MCKNVKYCFIINGIAIVLIWNYMLQVFTAFSVSVLVLMSVLYILCGDCHTVSIGPRKIYIYHFGL